MQNHRFFIATCFLCLCAAGAPAAVLAANVSSQAVLAQWFGIDVGYALDATREALADDDVGRRYRIDFTSDDGQRVNGVLAMPRGSQAVVRLAIAMHPMGSELGVWWGEDNPIAGGRITRALREEGYAVLTLDARRHGERRRRDLGMRDILERARGDNPRLYIDMIIGSVRDYRQALLWADGQEDLDTSSIVVAGYSMGAQMSLLLAAYEPRVHAVLAMVPPYVQRDDSPVAPRHHVGRIADADVLLLAARQDPYSSVEETRNVFSAIASRSKAIEFFDSKHVLPADYLTPALRFIADRSTGDPR